jgi:hypothetical protein
LLLLERLWIFSLFVLCIILLFPNRCLETRLLLTLINEFLCLPLVIFSIFVSGYRLTCPLALLLLRLYIKLFNPSLLGFSSDFQLWIGPCRHLCHSWCTSLLWVRDFIQVASLGASTILGAAQSILEGWWWRNYVGILHHKDSRCAVERTVGGGQVTLFTRALIQAAWLIQGGLELVEVWCLDRGQKMLGVYVTWLIAYNSALKDLLHVVLLTILWDLIDLRGNIFNISLFAFLLHSGLRSLKIEWRCLFISSAESSWSILGAAAFTRRYHHDLLSKHRVSLFLIAKQLLLIVVIGIWLSLKFLR